jgi:quercetin dioxygenase-like cupin family protein
MQRARNPFATGSGEYRVIETPPPRSEEMIEMAPNPTAITVHELEPEDRLPVADSEHTLYVSEGILRVVLAGDELALTSGDQIGVRSGELRRAWNAGRAMARVVVVTRPARAA